MPRSSAAFLLDMRLGKTHVAIRWAQHRSPHGIKLVVAPIVTHIAWCDELAADEQEYILLAGSSAQKIKQLDARTKSQHWVIVNPEGLRACPELLAGLPIAVVILDESPFIANPKAEITKFVQRRFKPVPNRAILTGEIAPEGLHQYYEQMKFVCGDQFMGCFSFWQWRLRYFHKVWHDWVENRTTKHLILQEVSKHAYRMNSDKIFKHKPVYVRRHCDMPPRLRSVYRKAVNDMELGDAQTKWTLTVRTWLSQLSGGILPDKYDSSGERWFSPHKLNELKSLLEGELAKKQVVVYFRYTRELLQAFRVLEDCTIVRGATPLAERKRRIRDFQEGRVRVIMFQAKCAKYAIPLWMASAAIFYSNYWDCGTRNQLEARLHGPKRTSQPLYVDLVTKGTVDEQVVKALREKKWGSREFLERIQEMMG